MKAERTDLIITTLLLGLLIVSFITRSLGSENQTTPKTGKTVLIYERKPCFGTCPVYKAEFFADGQVKVSGMQNVKLSGTKAFTFKVPREELTGILTQAESAGFFSFPDRFETLITDHPARELILFKKDQPKKVIFEESPPEGIAEVTSYLESLIEGKINAEVE